MDIRSIRQSWLRDTVAFMALLAPVAAQAYEEPPAHNNLYLEGTLPGAILVHVEEGGAKESEAIALTLQDGKLEGGIALPGARRLALRAEGPDGKLLYEGSAEFDEKDGYIPQVTLELKSLLDGTPAEVRLASHRVAVEFAGVERKGELHTRVTANVYDADGLRLEMREGELAWQIDDPWINENLRPCADFVADSLCGELPPRKPDGTKPTVTACTLDPRTCDLELLPPRPQIWKKVALSHGGHGCALKKDGRLYCWGRGDAGQLGFVAPKDCSLTGSAGSDMECALMPQLVQCAWGFCLFDDIAAGDRHTCALERFSQYVWCWGENSDGELGIGLEGFGPDADSTPIPHMIATTIRFVAVRAGGSSSCALSARAEVWCWGRNNLNIVPHRTDSEIYQPTRLRFPERIHAIDHYTTQACGQAPGGNLFCWGIGSQSQLGTGAFTPARPCANCPNEPLLMQPRVTALNNQRVDLMSTGDMGGCANVRSGDTACWGGLSVPNFGISTPLRDLSRGALHYCATTQSGVTLCAGSAPLGDGNSAPPSPGAGPVRVSAPPNFFRNVDTGNRTTCAIGADESVYCWGVGTFGGTGLGIGTTMVPMPLSFPSALTIPPPHTRHIGP